jgi:radical SAM protein with 4Fe4S-binding SPASM domain
MMAELDIADIFVNKYVAVNPTSLGVSPAADFLLVLDELCAIAAGIGNFYLYLPTMPRVADYLSARHGVHVSAKEQSCGAVDEAVLLADDGNLYPCSMARSARGDFRKDYTDQWGNGALAKLMKDFVDERAAAWSNIPVVCQGCEYRDRCAKMCVLNNEQSKYYEACEALETLTAEHVLVMSGPVAIA